MEKNQEYTTTENSDINSNISKKNQITMEFDTLKIDSKIRKEKEFKTNNAIFTFTNNQTDEEKYIVEIISKFKFIGILSKDLKRNGFGYYVYNVDDEKNSDKYAGEYKENEKEGNGIYIYANNNNNNNDNNDNDKDNNNNDNNEELYIGQWKNGKKEGKGFYFFKNNNNNSNNNSNNFISNNNNINNINNNNLNEGDYNVVFGNFNNDQVIDGYVISKIGNFFGIYKGKLIEGKKEDENAIYFENGNKAFKGKFINNEMKEGRVIIFQNNNEIETSYYFIKNEDDDIEFSIEKNEDYDEILKKSYFYIQQQNFPELVNNVYNFVYDLFNKIDNFEKMKVFKVKEEFTDKFEEFLNFVKD